MSRELTYLNLATDSESRAVSDAMARVGRTMATDRFDRDDGSSRFMLWRDEQRAIGGLMLDVSEQPRLIGFETFDSKYDERFADWFSTFGEDLRRPDASKSRGRAHMQQELARHVTLLDHEGIYSR